jgi:D-3-phosphoglycerate dehydrogenase / 2-oxoglutarate reductase
MPAAAVSDRRVFVYERMDPTDQSLDWLAERGIHVSRGRPMWQQPYARYTESEIIATASGYPALMGASGVQFTARVIDALPELRFISKFGVGVDNINLAAAARRGILIANTPEDSEGVDVAEHTLAMILALRKKLMQWTPHYMQQGGWRPGIFAETVAGSVVGLIGLGHVGRCVVERLQGWGVRIQAHDPYLAAAPANVQPVDLTTLLKTSDIVSLHATPSAENRHMIGDSAFDLMKPTAILINTARASLVDTQALIKALKSKRIAGAAVDVYDQEPPEADDELFRQDNLVVTPHTAAWSWKGVQNIAWHAARNLSAMMLADGHADLVNIKAQS